jgi:hypothetical protein
MEGEGEVSFAWRPMEGEGKVSFAWRPMEGEGEVSLLGGQWNVKEKPFSLLPTFPPTNLLKPSIISLTLKFYFTMVLGRYPRLSFLFFDL